MAFKNHRSKPDKNFSEVIKALRERCAGYWKDPKYPTHHHAHIQGLRVVAYDLNKVGSGFPDAEIWVSWLCLQFEVKQERKGYVPPKQGGGRTQELTDDQYYIAQLEDTELFYQQNHSSIVPIVWDRNQVYEWICRMAEFVLYVEGQTDDRREMIELFFPKVTKDEQTNFITE